MSSVKNGLYSIKIEMKDGARGRASGVIVLLDGKILGGDTHFHYSGSYAFQNGKWRGELTTRNLNGSFKPTMKRFADLDGPDFFPTPRWATFALIENEKFNGEIWECACGDGTMSRVLEETG